MRLRALCVLVLVAGCGGETTMQQPAPPPDMAIGPDLAPTCLPVEPGPPDGGSKDPGCPINKPAQADALDDALKVAGLDRCSWTISTKNYAGGSDPYRLPWFTTVHDWVVNGPPFARTLTTRLDDAARSPTPVANQLVLLG